MAVSVNSTGTVAYTGSGTSKNFTGLTIAAGSNRALVCSLTSSGNPTAFTVTWDGVAMTQLAVLNPGGTSFASVWGLINPNTGNKTLAFSWTGSCESYINAMCFNGVDQTSNATAFPSAGRVTASANNTSLTLTIPSNANNYCYQGNSLGPSQHRVTNSDTELHYNTTGSGNGEAQYGVGATSKVMTNSLDSTNVWTSAGVDIAALVAANTPVAKLIQVRQTIKRASYW